MAIGTTATDVPLGYCSPHEFVTSRTFQIVSDHLVIKTALPLRLRLNQLLIMRWPARTAQLNVRASSLLSESNTMGKKQSSVLMSLALVLASTQAFGGSAGERYSYGPPTDNVGVVVADPQIGATRYTCTLDIPWDWAHRCPPVPYGSPSNPVVRPSVLGCSQQSVKTAMGDGKERTVTIVRCP